MRFLISFCFFLHFKPTKTMSLIGKRINIIINNIQFNTKEKYDAVILDKVMIEGDTQYLIQKKDDSLTLIKPFHINKILYS